MILKHASIGRASIDFRPSFLTAMARMESIRLQEGALSATWTSNFAFLNRDEGGVQ
ncbi:hypothetical protein GQ55_6G040100 [Panicum hallii var. hallii]|uniref:Uncharacterized protein n=1 Tax=Panicum hallii var. hallii TaxID=1504633 RepID=A0A2T7D3M9_9POAL|nr:hypothetical protein GQ55_6G040100 [Panicum hallii var. hallii]